MKIPLGERERIIGADVVVLPSGFCDSEWAFAQSVYYFICSLPIKRLPLLRASGAARGSSSLRTT